MTQLRILSGEWRGHRLHAPPLARPASARAREALFSILLSEQPIANATVLDSYAGSGALGLEALSRGASTAAFFERHPSALRDNIRALDCARRVLLIARDATKPPPPPTPTIPIDLAFFDPPWRLDVLPALLACAAAGWFADESRIVALARDSHSASPWDKAWHPFVLSDVRKSGDTQLLFLRLAPSPQETAPPRGFDRSAAEVLDKEMLDKSL
ncbi:MAG: RsmD family RNA methyltransferase [Alphaproteobacteria bacterium]